MHRHGGTQIGILVQGVTSEQAEEHVKGCDKAKDQNHRQHLQWLEAVEKGTPNCDAKGRSIN